MKPTLPFWGRTTLYGYKSIFDVSREDLELLLAERERHQTRVLVFIVASMYGTLGVLLILRWFGVI